MSRIRSTHYKDNWEFKVGGEYLATERLAIRAGFFFAQAATKLRGLNAASNDLDLLIPSAGIAYRFTDAFEVMVGSSYNGGIEREYHGQRFDVDIGIAADAWDHRRNDFSGV